MAFAMWAKPMAESKLSFVKGFGKAVKTWRELFQRTFLERAAPKPKGCGLEVPRVDPRGKCLLQLQPRTINRQKSTLQSRIFQSFFSKTTSKNLASELRRQSSLRLSSGPVNSFRNVPIMSLVGVTLGVNIKGLMDNGNERMMSEMREMFQGFTWETDCLEKVPTCLDDLDIHQDSIANGCEGAVYKAKVKSDAANTVEPTAACANVEDYDLAIKAVFNYGVESNSASIVRAMEKEIIPLRPEGCSLLSELGQRVNRLPPHPNIVDMPGYFVDDMLVTEEGRQKFPAAMPHKIDPDKCYGRNKTLYLLMRRRSFNLREYLARSGSELTMEARCMMLAQVLQGVVHMNEHGVAHRDLKTDNILVEVPSDGDIPRLEVCDFGCCLAEKSKSLIVPYRSRDQYLGGNSWLMAPEITSALPGPHSILDFRKSDLWAVGAIAYEILGAENPFYPSQTNSYEQLSSRTYTRDQLPSLPDTVPAPVQRLVKALLGRDPSKRPSADVAAAVMQIVAMESLEKRTDNTSNRRGDSSNTPALKGGIRRKSRFSRRTSESSSTRSNVIAAVNRERKMLQWVLGKSLALLCQLTFGSQSTNWDLRAVTNFLFLSRLNYADFKMAMKFF